MHLPVTAYNMRKMQIQVLTRDGRKNIYETDRSRNVADLKKRIGRTMNVPMAFSRITYKGRLLTNDSILEDEGVKRMSTLELHWQPLVLTLKQYREKELELDKLDQKQRHISRIAEKKLKKGGHERTPGGLPRPRDSLCVKRSLSPDDLRLSTFVSNSEQKIDETVQNEGVVGSSSSDELDFLAAYWCCSKSATAKKSRKRLDPAGIQYVDVGRNMLRGAQNKEARCKLKGTDSGTDLLNDLVVQSCPNRKHQPICAELPLASSRVSCRNIREEQKNCEK